MQSSIKRLAVCLRGKTDGAVDDPRQGTIKCHSSLGVLVEERLARTGARKRE
jgi:hypothetical protein